MKKIFICLLVFLSVFLIYLCNMDRKVYYLTLGSSVTSYNDSVNGYPFYVKNYLERKGVLEAFVDNYTKYDYRISDIINDIDENKKVIYGGKNVSLKNALIKADLVTLSIDSSDVYNKFVGNNITNDIYDYVDELADNLEVLFKEIRKYCKEDVILVGYFNVDNYSPAFSSVISYLDKRYREVSINYNVSYISLDGVLRGRAFTDKDSKIISDKVISVLEKNLFEA